MNRMAIQPITYFLLRPKSRAKTGLAGQNGEHGRDESDPDQGVSHTGACGGLTTRILVALSALSSAISAALSVKSKTSRFSFRCWGFAVRGMAHRPSCTR